jgi:hypothetical protein
MGYHFPPMVQQHQVGQGLLIIKATRSHSVRHTTLGRLLCTTDQHHTETSTWQHSQETGVHDAAGFEHGIPASERQQIQPWKAWPLRPTVIYCIYTECPRRNVPGFGRVFLMLKYTDITQNTYVQSWTGTEIMAREKCGLLWGSTHCTCQLTVYQFPSLSVVSY